MTRKLIKLALFDVITTEKTEFLQRAWMPSDMQTCSHSSVCPNCDHRYTCYHKRSLSLTGGGLVVGKESQINSGKVLPRSPFSQQQQQISPSSAITFNYPIPFEALPVPQQTTTNVELELQQLGNIVQALRQSGWFHEGITFEASHALLEKTLVGTFLVRNSSNPKFLFSISVQTDRGPTSVRLHYSHGYFRLVAQPHLQELMPGFSTVIDLIQYYINEYKTYERYNNIRKKSSNTQVWVDEQGRWHSTIIIHKPLKKRDKPPSLKHLARLAIHKTIQASCKPRLNLLTPQYKQLELPNSLITYLDEYPYGI